MNISGGVERNGVALLASRLSRLGEDPCGGSEVVLWEDAEIMKSAGIPVRVYARSARPGSPVNVIPLHTSNAQFHSFEYAGQLLARERHATIVTYNEPVLAGLAPSRTIVRYDWNTPLPRYWNLPFWLGRFQRARYLFPSDSERRLFLGQAPRIPEQNAIVISNAVDLKRFRPSGKNVDRSQTRSLRVGFAGQWVPGKGIDQLLEAWQAVKHQVPLAELHLAGGSAMWRNVHGVARADESAAKVQAAAERGMVHCRGALPRLEMPAFWNSVDIAVMPSLSESFGLVALEALACGVPVVSTSSGGLKEIVVDRECGLLVPPGDVTALADALLAVLTNDTLRLTLAAQARGRANRFSLEGRSHRLLRLLGAANRSAATVAEATTAVA